MGCGNSTVTSAGSKGTTATSKVIDSCSMEHPPFGDQNGPILLAFHKMNQCQKMTKGDYGGVYVGLPVAAAKISSQTKTAPKGT
ncbi:overexpressed in colon carcinoma 1 protein [Pantherophis guttatus]|uniref:Overexpressed in colon carcinoma 1 protein n=1 Tax=Pantherophis guttatus TaxID=94885 RepID=A0A6P9ATS4_PANGU|nr:overexpressed in colon carcinoma 1 protein [Pantherophis guttatus]